MDRDDEECWFEEDDMEDRYIEEWKRRSRYGEVTVPLLRRSCTIIYVAFWNDPVMTSVTQMNYTASFTLFIVIIITV